MLLPCCAQPVDVTFRVDSRVRAEDEKPTEPFHSFAEKVLAFCSNMAHSIKSAVSIPAGPFVARATSPAPFKLATDELASRRGPHTVMSKEEEELKMMKEHKPFKARPVDPRVMNSAGVVGLSKVPRKPTTIAEPFALESERLHKKAMEDKAKHMTEEAERLKREAAFKAAPVPAAAKVPEPTRATAPRAPTVPAPPALSTDDRAAAREKFEAEKASRAADAERAAVEAALRAKVCCFLCVRVMDLCFTHTHTHTHVLTCFVMHCRSAKRLQLQSCVVLLHSRQHHLRSTAPLKSCAQPRRRRAR